MKLLKITPEGEFSIVTTTRENLLYCCHKEIGCTCIEMPSCVALPGVFQLIVDESGLLKEGPKLNSLPWFWYSRLHEAAPIVGTVLVGRLARVGDLRELDVVGLTDEDIKYFQDWENIAAELYTPCRDF